MSGHGCRAPSQSTNANQDERVFEGMCDVRCAPNESHRHLALVPCDAKVTKDGSYAPKMLVSHDVGAHE